MSLGYPDFTVRGAPAGRHLRYPLAVGNSWDYSFRTTYARVIDGQSEPPRVTVITLRDELIGVQHLGTQDYFALRESQSTPGSTVALMREDSNGLFVLLVNEYTAPGIDAYTRALGEVSAAVGRLPATAISREACDRAAARLAAKLLLPQRSATDVPPHLEIPGGEQQWLAYPLFVGARWTLTESPPTECTVIARERVRVPAGTTLAWRVRITSPGLSDDDRLENWYSAAGLVRYHARLEEDITDFQGNVIGTLKYEADEALTSFHLEGAR